MLEIAPIITVPLPSRIISILPVVPHSQVRTVPRPGSPFWPLHCDCDRPGWCGRSADVLILVIVVIVVIPSSRLKHAACTEKRASVPEGIIPRAQVARPASTKGSEHLGRGRAAPTVLRRRPEGWAAGAGEGVHDGDVGEEASACVPCCALVEFGRGQREGPWLGGCLACILPRGALVGSSGEV